MNQRLFVYGTLAPERANAHILKPVKGTWQPATVRGRLYQQGWGAAMGFPGIIIDPDAEPVEGLLFSSPDLHQHWARLDDFEGEGYRRVEVGAELGDGSIVSAYVYELSETEPLDSVN